MSQELLQRPYRGRLVALGSGSIMYLVKIFMRNEKMGTKIKGVIEHLHEVERGKMW